MKTRQHSGGAADLPPVAGISALRSPGPIALRVGALLLFSGGLLGCAEPELPLESLYASAYESFSTGDLEAASEAAETGLRRASVEPHRSWSRAFTVLEAEILTRRGQDAAALELLERAAASSGDGAPIDAVDARALMTRGSLACRARRDPEGWRESESLFARANDVATQLASERLGGEIHLRRGTCEVLHGRLQDAENSFEQALATARTKSLLDLYTNAAGSLGWLRTRTGRFDEATEWLERSLETAERIGADIPRAKTLSNLGWCYFELGDYERALPILHQAEALTEELGLTRDRHVVLTNLGRTLFMQGDFEGATKVYGSALELTRELGDRRETAQIFSNLALASFGTGSFDRAESHVRASLNLKREVEDWAGEQNSLLHLSTILQERGLNREAEKLCLRVIESEHTEPNVLWEAHGALAQLYAKTGRTAEAEKELETSLALMDASSSRLQNVGHRMSFFSSLKGYFEDAVEFWVDTGRPIEALEVVIESRGRLLRERLPSGSSAPAAPGGPDLAAQKDAGEQSPSQILKRYSARTGTILLSFWTGQSRSFLWIIHPDGIELRALPGEGALRRDIEAYQAAILRSGDPLGEGALEGSELWRTLIAPVAELIPPGSRVIAALDGPLHLLNLETLVVPGDEPRFWIEDVTLAFTPTLGSVEFARRAPARNGDGGGLESQILLIGDPLPPNDDFPRLAHAGLEIQRIAEIFGPGRREIHSGVHADPGAYARARPERFDFIHLAAHVTANRQVPLDSAVILSPSSEAYKLYARDVVQTPLQAELVTLSACRSAGSRAFAGEGLVGLAWAFMNAGSRHVIGGLWDVEDASTSELMQELYLGLEDGLDPASALRRAKLELLRSETAYRKPFYWAPFVAFRGPAGEA
ncbi:MAG: CHAT domain-containing tetratricopeptide repeat protein [Acidobacteriota bacterium]